MNRSIFSVTKFPIFQINILFFFKNGLNQENKNSFTKFPLLMKSKSRFFSSSSKYYYKDNKYEKNEKNEERSNFSFNKNETQQVGRKETEEKETEEKETEEKEKEKRKENFFQNFKMELKKNIKQPKRDLGVSGYNRGKLFVGIKKDFTGFIINSLIISVFLYSLFTLAPKETISQRRKRIIRERLMKEYDINEQDLELLEDFNEAVEK